MNYLVKINQNKTAYGKHTSKALQTRLISCDDAFNFVEQVHIFLVDVRVQCGDVGHFRNDKVLGQKLYLLRYPYLRFSLVL
jgi:hypothetical protein